MAEKFFDKQINFGWGLSFNMTGKAPVVSKRIFDTLADAEEYANDFNDSAIEGLLLSVIADNEQNNGVYFVQSIKRNAGDENAVLIKVGSDKIEEIEESINKKFQEIQKDINTLENDNTQNKSEIKKINDDLISNTNVINKTIEEVSESIIKNTEEITKNSQSIEGISEDVIKNTEEIVKNNQSIEKISEDVIKNTEEIAKNRKAIEELGDINLEATIPDKIIVAGLDGQFGAGNYTNGYVIDAGTNIYDILQNILCRELYPTSVNAKSVNAISIMNDLTLLLSHNNIVEVGTVVKLIEGKTNGGNVSVTQDSQITGITYGYSTEDNDTKEYANTTITSNCVTELKDSIYTISSTINEGFDANGTVNTPIEKEADNNVSLDETIIGCINEGNNEITISASGATYSYRADAINKIYYCSNLGKTDASQYHPGVDAVDSETTRPSKTATANITGAYRYFMGYSANTSYDQFDSDSIRNLNLKQNWINKDGVTTIVDSNTIKSNGESIVIACPNSYKLTTIENPPADLLPLFLSSGSGSDGIVKVKCGDIDVDYHVYVYPITNNVKVDFKNVTLTKQ